MRHLFCSSINLFDSTSFSLIKFNSAPVSTRNSTVPFLKSLLLNCTIGDCFLDVGLIIKTVPLSGAFLLSVSTPRRRIEFFSRLNELLLRYHARPYACSYHSYVPIFCNDYKIEWKGGDRGWNIDSHNDLLGRI